MKLGLLAIGRMKAGPERELLARYLGRAEVAARGTGLSGLSAIEIDESRARTSDQRKRDEAAALIERVPPGGILVLLDERGANQGSDALAADVARWRDSGTSALSFAIGGPDGFDPDFLATHRTLSFGRATFPHQLVRVLMAEQIYRIITILTGHPYHRA